METQTGKSRITPNIKLDLARRQANADDMKWIATRLLPLTLKAIKQDRL